MMELTCVFVLTFAGIVAASPFGYGIKGGAGAKADSSAVAGAFGGTGSVPAGGGAFSGSFSKASSSSFASSSASSSASSFSYSGTGSTGPTRLGCTTSGCQKDSEGGISHGANGSTRFEFPAQTDSNAAAITVAGASAGAYSQNAGHAPCTSGGCSNQKPSDCQGPNCDNTNKCTSGQCGASSPSKNSESDGINDIPVNVAGTAGSKTTSDAHSSQYDKAGGAYQPTLGCPNGNCVSSSNGSPSYPYANTNPASVSENLKPKCNSPHCNDNSYNSQSGTQNSASAPALHLTAPKEYPNPGTGRLPLTYNNPIQNTYLSPTAGEKDSPCSSGKCNNNHLDGSYNPANGNTYSSNNLGPNFPNTKQKDLLSDNKCKSGNCAPIIYNNENPQSPQGSSYSQISSYQTPTAPKVNCATGNCGSYPSVAPSLIGTSTYPSSKHPSYTQGLSGPGGNCASGNCGSYPSAAASPTGASTYPNSKIPSYTQAPSGSGGNCASENCGSYPSEAASPAGASTHLSSKIPSYTQAPSSPGGSCASGNCGSYPSAEPSPTGASTYLNSKIPSYTQAPSGFGGNCASGNCGSYPSMAPSSTGASTYPSSKIPSYTPGLSGPGGNCASGNCGSYPSAAPSPTGASTYPNSKIPSYTQAPLGPGGNCASGNCGKHPLPASNPTGASAYPSYSHGTSPTFSSTGPTASTNCLTPNCVQSLRQNTKPSITFTPPYTAPSSPGHNGVGAGAITSAGSVGVPKPSSGVYPSTEEKLPPYTGGFGGPSGILKPHEYSLPSKPAYPIGQTPTNQPSYPEASATPSSSQGASATSTTSNNYNKPTASTGLYKPDSCTSGNCGSQPGQSAPSYGSIKGGNAANAGALASASANAIAYSGGFGGPPGVLKPYDGGKLGNNGAPSSASKPGYQNGVQSGNYGISSAGQNSPYGDFGNGAGSGSHTGAVGNGNHLPYSSSLNGARSGSQAVAGAPAAATAGAFAGAFNPGSSYNGSRSPTDGCSGGCGSGGGGSPYGGGHNFGTDGGVGLAGASAKSVAGATSGSGAGSYGQAGSFASSSASAHASSGFPTKGGYGR